MRRGFTVIEIIFVVTIVAILIGIAAPRLLEKDDLSLAADQVIGHIRYTQHLALMDDRFDPNDARWFESRWQIYFHSNAGSDDKLAYTIFKDNNYNNNPDPNLDEIARNPLDRSKFLTGGFNSIVPIPVTDPSADPTLCLGCTYDITGINFSPSCTNHQGETQSRRISFGEIGRPYYQNADTNPYRSDRRVLTVCTITLTHQSGDTARICIEPETGYTHRCD
ncbi:MAG: Tfp pilus assembly protein FimT/FimU [Campylobacterales bacterium]